MNRGDCQECSSPGELDHWHPILPADQLRHNPVAVGLHGINIVLFRGTQGQIGALEDRCPHEIRLDVGILEGLADQRADIEGMKLSRFDKVLALNREHINRVYRGLSSHTAPLTEKVNGHSSPPLRGGAAPLCSNSSEGKEVCLGDLRTCPGTSH